ncbi:hypothetical protein BC751_2407 [Cecembia calidifontis]|jgi:hypothetical protein|uniref:Uncharacterized protein n=1 Tax=Cecembia calidifontis TaxID=1187080 RepID=A0A4Q7P9C8_9BACT|nr:hypothetical protein BC751_2407 [Cecembia calidifontis]
MLVQLKYEYHEILYHQELFAFSGASFFDS